MTSAVTDTTIRSGTTSAGYTVEVYGPLTWRDLPAFRSAVSDHRGAAHILIDVTGATAIDSAGTGALIASYLEADRDGVPIAVLAQGEVFSIIDRVGLPQLLPVFTDRERSAAWMMT